MDHSKSAQQAAYEKIEQGWEAVSSPPLTPEEKFVPNYSEEPKDDLQTRKRSREYYHSRPDLTSDYQLKAISLEGGVISVYITLTPEAARNPQILSSFLRKSETLSQDPFFGHPFHDPVASPSIKKEVIEYVAS